MNLWTQDRIMTRHIYSNYADLVDFKKMVVSFGKVTSAWNREREKLLIVMI